MAESVTGSVSNSIGRPSCQGPSLHSDTSAEMEAVQLRLLGEKTPAERGAIAFRLSQEMALASKRAIRRAYPQLTADEVNCFFVELHYGSELAEGLRQFLIEGYAANGTGRPTGGRNPWVATSRANALTT